MQVVTGSQNATALSSKPTPAPEDLGFDEGRLDVLRSRYQRGVTAGEIPGAHVIVLRDGKVVLDEVFGYADPVSRKPMTRETVFQLASMTKPVISVAAMILAEQGLIHLGDPVSRFLPELANPQVALNKTAADGETTTVLVPADQEPTVQDLLRHTAGYTYPIFGTSPLHRMWDGVIDMANMEHSSLTDFIARVGRRPLLHQPGTTWEYSVATDVLGALIERASGERLDHFIERALARPLRMSTLGFFVSSPEIVAKALELQGPAAVGSPPYPPTAPPKMLSGGAGMYATAGDYARFAQMLLNGGQLDGVRILAPKTVSHMTANHLGPGTVVPKYMADLQSVMAPTPEMGQGWGLGFAVRTAPGRNPAPGSVGEFYWAGSSGTYFWVDPQERLTVVAATAQPQNDIKVRYRQLARQMVYQALIESNPPLAQNPAGNDGFVHSPGQGGTNLLIAPSLGAATLHP